MNRNRMLSRLCGCYVTVPTAFRDPDLELNLPAIRRHVNFLLAGGIREGTGMLLVGGAAGDFSTMTTAERLQVAETVVREADGQVPVVFGAQTTNSRELVELARSAQYCGADYLQVSPPFYFSHTEQDFFEYIAAAAEAAPKLGIIVYNTYWTSISVSQHLIDKLLEELPSVVGLKWSAPDTGFMEFESCLSQYSDRLAIIDNQCRFVVSHMLGARGIESHPVNHWPQWGVRLWELLEAHQYQEAQQEIVRVMLPYMKLWTEMEQYTSGDGYLDKLCMELVGLDSSRCRPPTRDVRDQFRGRASQMLVDCGTPGVSLPHENGKTVPLHPPAVEFTKNVNHHPHFPEMQKAPVNYKNKLNSGKPAG